MKLGYIADRTGLIPMSEQMSILIAYGVDEEHIYTPVHGLDAAVSSCDRGRDELVVHSAAVIGANAYPRTVKALAKLDALLYVHRKNLLIDCKAGEGVADGALDIKDHAIKSGKRTGPKNKVTHDLADKIIAYVEEGNTQLAASKLYGVHTSLVSRIINHTYIFGEIK